MEYRAIAKDSDELIHYGVLGMKRDVRRKYHNKDGSLNTTGKQKDIVRS